MINTLQSLRGIFAIFIFLHHIMYNGDNLFLAGGPCGVCFFFILSGFVMCAGWEKKVENSSVTKTQLYLRRVIRVYPLHLLCLGITIILSISHLSGNYLLTLIPNLLLLQSWIPIKSVYFSGNALSWCLCDLMFFYLVFPFIMLLIEKRRPIFIYGIILLIPCYLCGIYFVPSAFSHALIYINPAFRLVDFLIGISLWQIWLKIRAKNLLQVHSTSTVTRYANLFEFGSIAILILTIVLSGIIPESYWYDAYWWLSTSIMIFVFTFFNKSGGVLDIVLSNKYLVLFGNISFSFYMIHQIGLSILSKIYKVFLGDDYNVLISILPSFIVISVASYYIYQYYETPVSNHFIKMLKKKYDEKAHSI